MNGISGAVASGASRHAVLMVAACRSSSLFVAERSRTCARVARRGSPMPMSPSRGCCSAQQQEASKEHFRRHEPLGQRNCPRH